MSFKGEKLCHLCSRPLKECAGNILNEIVDSSRGSAHLGIKGVYQHINVKLSK
jgi:hypothetical protein